MSEAADASASMALEDDSLSAGLESIAAKFEAIAAQINTGFAGANAQLTRTATATATIGQQAPLISNLAGGMELCARAGQMVATGAAGIVTTLVRMAPLVNHIPDSFGRWVAPLKAATAEFSRAAAAVGAVTAGASALQGRLGALSAGFLAMHLAELGASKGMAVLGAAGTLAASKIISGVRAASNALLSLPAATARASRGLASGLGGAMGGISRSTTTAAMVLAPLAGMAMVLGPVGAAAMATAGAFTGLGKSIDSAAQMQTFSASMATLLGGTKQAQARMAELSRFSAETPFDLPGVVKASKVLQTLTNGTLATGAGLRLVGDVASISGQSFEDIAVHVGRLYDGLMSGRPVGEASARLQQLGLISAATRNKLETLQASGAKGKDVWAIAATSLSRFSGEMARQSTTWGGIMSNFGDGVGRVFTAIGEPLIVALTPFMLRMNNWLGTLLPWAQRFGAQVAGWAALFAQVFADGKAGKVLELTLKIGFAEAVNFLVRGLVAAGSALKELLTSDDTWATMGDGLKGAMNAAVSVLLSGLADAMRQLEGMKTKAGEKFDKLAKGAEGTGRFGLGLMKFIPVGGSFLNAAGNMAIDASKSKAGSEWLGDSFGSKSLDEMATSRAAKSLEGFSRASEGARPALETFTKSFNENYSSTGRTMESGAEKSELHRLLGEAWVAGEKERAQLAAAAQQGGLPSAKPDPNADEASGKKKTKEEAAALQRVAGGGGIALSGRDPLLNTANSQLSEIKGLRTDVQNLTRVIRRPNGIPIFA